MVFLSIFPLKFEHCALAKSPLATLDAKLKKDLKKIDP